MGRYFLQDTPFKEYERLMMECPNSVRDDNEDPDRYEPKQVSEEQLLSSLPRRTDP